MHAGGYPLSMKYIKKIINFDRTIYLFVIYNILHDTHFIIVLNICVNIVVLFQLLLLRSN